MMKIGSRVLRSTVYAFVAGLALLTVGLKQEVVDESTNRELSV